MTVLRGCLVVLGKGECGRPDLPRLHRYCSSLVTQSHVLALMAGLCGDCPISVTELRGVFHFLTPYIFSGQPRGGWALLKPWRRISSLGPNHCLESHPKVSEYRSYVLHEESSGSWVGKGLLSISGVKETARGHF